jgi:UDP-GlcNAc:undecaprenyl-phosphate GlcNAc-1-phosphate transferase
MVCISSGIGAALSIYTKNDVTTIVCTTLAVVALIVMRLFGHVECQLLLNKLSASAARIVQRGRTQRNDRDGRAMAVQLQGERQWTLLWESLTEWGDKLHLLHIVLDVNLPAMREGFHANWNRPSHRERHEVWRLDFPLFVDGLAVGRLEVAGDHLESDGSVGTSIERLVDLLEPFEKAFAAVATSPTAAATEKEVKVLALTNSAARSSLSKPANANSFVSAAAADTASSAAH